MMKIQLFISCVFILLVGCAAKQTPVKSIAPPAVCITDPPNVTITMIEGSVLLTCKEKQHVVRRTNYFCKQKKRSPVTGLVIYKRIINKSYDMQVRYHCSRGEDGFRKLHI